MLLDLYNIKYIVSIFLTAFIIKLLDDYLDTDESGFSFVIENLGRGLLPYSLAIFSISALLNLELTVSLFTGAYIVGMLKDLNHKLPLGFRSYQESIIVFILFSILIGLWDMTSSLIVILIIQILDDIIDLKKDRYYNNKNIVITFGLGEVIILLIIVFIIALKLDSLKTISCLLVFHIYQCIEYLVCEGEREWI